MLLLIANCEGLRATPSRSCALATNATWFTAAPVQYTWRAALRASPRPSTAVWLDWFITTETALVPCMQDIDSTIISTSTTIEEDTMG